MNNKIEVDRDTLEAVISRVVPYDEYINAKKELRALLAAPDVERQPVPITEGTARLVHAYSIGEFMLEGGSPTVEAMSCASYDENAIALKEHDFDSYAAGYQAAMYEEVKSLMYLVTSPPAPVSVALDERAEFAKWVRREWPQAPLSNVRDLLPKDHPRYGEYCDQALQRAWVGWQARACLDKVKELNQSPGYTAVDMASAAADGFRDGRASVVVDLTDLSNCFSPDGCGDWAMWLEDVKKLVEAAGGTVKN